MAELATTIELIRDLNNQGTHAADMSVLSVNGGTVTAADNFTQVRTSRFETCTRKGALLLVGSERPDPPTLAMAFSKARAHGQYVLAFSNAVLALNARGAFGHSAIATPWYDAMSRDMLACQEDFDDRIFNLGRNFGTSAGRLSTPHAVIALLSRQLGARKTAAVAERTLLGHPRGATAKQRLGVRDKYRVEHPKLIELLELFEARFEDSLSMAQVADGLGISVRQLERIAGAELRTTPSKLLESIRVQWARWRLENSSMPVTEIAYACGFGRPENLTRTFRRRFGTDPQAFRELALDPPAIFDHRT